jgi:hypothetical protein
MNEHRRQILQMLAEGKISAEEAERLLAAVETPARLRRSFCECRSILRTTTATMVPRR